MRSTTHDILPLPTRRSLVALGRNLRIARTRRRFTIAVMAERCGLSPATYRRMEKGDPTVAIGAWAMALFVLGETAVLGTILAPPVDEVGMALDEGRLPRRVRPPSSLYDGRAELRSSGLDPTDFGLGDTDAT
jgi:transcriptional regulator with XRE-family HTH domain